MDEVPFAQLDADQLHEINALEQKLGVTLIAYELARSVSNEGSAEDVTDAPSH